MKPFRSAKIIFLSFHNLFFHSLKQKNLVFCFFQFLFDNLIFNINFRLFYLNYLDKKDTFDSCLHKFLSLVKNC